ncbi:hypothetical protein AB0H57_13180 [Micromonospora sp. NPDC050686]|uniref:hypothetical protein n=1 Tax=Micromonospora sp. NPDC050686 TaxID=3154631 RepID=UPI0033F8B572
MIERLSRFARLTDGVLGGVRERTRRLLDEFSTSDAPERALVAPLLPEQQLRYVGLGPACADDLHRTGRQFTDTMSAELAEALDPAALFGLLNIVNPVAWVDAVMTPVRMAAQALLVAGGAAALAARDPDTARADAQHAHAPAAKAAQPMPLTPEQEAFRALFRLSPYRPLAVQLAEIAYRRRYAFSGDLATRAGSLLLFLDRYTGTPLAVTDTHLHLLRMGRRPDAGKPDRREPRLLWSVERRHVARIDSGAGIARVIRFPSTIAFSDGSWIRIVNQTLRDDHMRFVAAVRDWDIPGTR